MNRLYYICCLIVLLVATALAQPGRTLKVGPGKTYKLPSQAAAAARDGDTVEIDAGVYDGDVAVWTANNLVLRGV
jgi:hypothetical protein